MTLSRPPRTTKALAHPAKRGFDFDGEQLLVLAIAVLLMQSGAPLPLLLALLYIAL